MLTVLALGGCSAPAADEQPAAVPAATLATPSLSPQQALENCAVDEDGGSYYVTITSWVAGDLSACAGGTRYNGTIDTILDLPGADRRCIISPPYPYDALVGVYSDGKKADQAAAKARCARDGGSNQ